MAAKVKRNITIHRTKNQLNQKQFLRRTQLYMSVKFVWEFKLLGLPSLQRNLRARSSTDAENVLRPNSIIQLLTMLVSFVLNIFITVLVHMKSKYLICDFCRLQTSSPYNSIGTHLLNISFTRHSSLAQPATLIKILFAAR